MKSGSPSKMSEELSMVMNFIDVDASGVRNIECSAIFAQGDRWAIVDWDLEFDVGDGGEEPDSVEVDDDEALIVVDDIGDVVDNREVDEREG